MVQLFFLKWHCGCICVYISVCVYINAGGEEESESIAINICSSGKDNTLLVFYVLEWGTTYTLDLVPEKWHRSYF